MHTLSANFYVEPSVITITSVLTGFPPLTPPPPPPIIITCPTDAQVLFMPYNMIGRLKAT